MGVVVTGNVHTPAPQGVHQAVCVDIVDMGLQKQKFGNEPERQVRKIRIVWQLDEIDETKGRRFVVSKWYTASLHEKATLRKDLQSWRGRPFTSEELKGFDLDKILGSNCQINIVHKQKEDGGTFGAIEAVMPLAKGMTKIGPVDYVREQDRPKDETNDSHEPTDEEMQQAIEDSVPF